jgi:hypothetical protein
MSVEHFEDRCSPFDPYSKEKLGWINPIIVSGSLPDQEITDYMSTGEVYKLTNTTHEYFLVSNQKNLASPSSWEEKFPGQGLLIWHVDTTGSNLFSPMPTYSHKLVDVETTDGLFDTLENEDDSTGADLMDYGFYGYYECFFNDSTKQAFTPTSNPNTNGYTYDSEFGYWKQTVQTGIYVDSIRGAGGGTMTANLFGPNIWWGPDTVNITSDYVVQSGTRLHIVSGTVIKFTTTDAQNVGNDATRCELIVHGTLEAWGESNDSIVFCSAAANPSDSAWYGVEVTSTGSLDLHYCKIKDALAGISWTSSGSYEVSYPHITHCQTGIRVDNSVTAGVKYSLLDNNKTGLRVKTNGVANVDSSSIQGGNVNVLVDSLGNANLNYCTMSELHSSVCLNRSGNATLNWTTITGPAGMGGGSDTGVVVNSGALAHLSNCNIRKSKYGMFMKSTTGRTKSVGCTFDSTDVGIYFNNSASDSVISCIFKNNLNKGMWVLNSSLLDSNCTFVDSTGNHNGAVGIYCQSNCSIKTSYFQGYQFGIKVMEAGKYAGVSPIIEGCGFYNIGDIGIYSSNSYPAIKKCCFKGTYDQYCIHIYKGNPYISQCYMASEDDGIPIGILFTGGATGKIRRTAIWDYDSCAVSIDNTSKPDFGHADSVACNWFEKPDAGEYSFYSQNNGDTVLALWNFWEAEDESTIQSYMGGAGEVNSDSFLGHCMGCYPYYASLCADLPPSDPEFYPCKIATTPEGEKHNKYFVVSQNYPNPFNPVTLIKYNLPEFCHVVINVYNVLGQKVRTVVDEDQTTGSQNVFWDGKDTKGKDVASGIYFYKITAGVYEESKQMILLR